MSTHNYNYPMYAKILHLGLAGFGIAAFLTGELAEDGNNSFGYLLHAYLGLSLGAFMLSRLLFGFTSSGVIRFSSWSFFSRRQWATAFEDVRNLFRLRVPERGPHEGLAGLTQALGLIIFSVMALTGTWLFVLGGGAESSTFEVIEEIHELGEPLIPLYLALHIGAVILHTVAGKSIWKRMFSFSRN